MVLRCTELAVCGIIHIMKKKFIIIAVVVLAIAATSTTVMALHHKNDTSSKKSAVIASDTQQTAQTEETSTATKAPDTTTPVAAKATQTTTQSTAEELPPEPKPDFGKDADSGKYLVFNQSGIMDDAGISASDQVYVSKIVTHLSDWQYAGTWANGDINLCTLTASQMHQASAAADWKTNPTAQLKACATYASQSYGGWKQYAQHLGL